MLKFTTKTGLLMLTLSAGLPALAGQTTTLHVATSGPPGHVQNSVVLPTWGKWIEEATDGRVKIKLEYNLGDQGSYFSMVEDGVADAAWSYHGYVPGRFKLTEMVELPGLGVNAEAASQAYWETYTQYFSDAGEHDGIALMGLFTHGPGQIHSRQAINTLSDLQDAKIRLGGGMQRELGTRLNVTPVSAPGEKVYEMMQQGVVDGVLMPAASQKDFRLAEVAPHLTQLPGGLYLGSFAIFANEEFLDSLQPDDKAAILNVSGARLSKLAGRAWDQSDQSGLAMAQREGVQIHNVGYEDPLTKELQDATTGMDQRWLEKIQHPAAQNALTALRTRAQALQQQISVQ